MTTYIPYPFYHDDVPIDISFVFEEEKPAGKHGFLQVSGRDFVFEDGTKVKFWGTNFNGCGCFPEHDYAEKLAKRLAKIGINLVRFHQLDSEWHTPNIFAFTKGKRMANADLDPVSMDRLDYLIYCLKKEGIYCYLDMFTYRKFRSSEGVENAHLLPDAGKPYCNYSRRLIDLQKDLCRRLWTHLNPYTGLAYCSDPVFVLAEIVNESDLFKPSRPIIAEPYAAEFKEYFEKWLQENGMDEKVSDHDINDFSDKIMDDFKKHLMRAYYKEMIEFMRDLGVKIPITGTNWPSSPSCTEMQLMTDFLDSHSYCYDWRWGEFEKHCANRGITQQKQSYLFDSALLTSLDKPTYISEWDMPWPNEFRAESPIYTAAVGMLQGWNGFAIHTYSYTTRLDRMNMLGKETSAEKIGNVPYRQGIFSAWNDPAKFGLFYHAALITRRGDVAEAKNTLGIEPLDFEHWNKEASGSNVEKSRIISCLNGDTRGLPLISTDDNIDEVTSDTGELYRSWKKEYGTVNTRMTKCAYGFLGKNPNLDLTGVKISCRTDFAVIAMSSLTDRDICSSDNILLTTVGRAKNTDSRFEGELMLDIGRPPVLIESIVADIEIETNVKGLAVWAVNAEGFYIGTIPAVYENGKLSFTVGKVSKSMYYLIVKD